MRLMLIIPLMLSFLLLGCVTHLGAPQSREEFVTKVQPGGFGRKAEHMTINRPFNTVLSDLRSFSDKCLNVRVSRGANSRTHEVGGSTTYHPKFTSNGKKTSLSVQEEYGSKRANSGAPPGGLFVVVTELRPIGDSKTQIDIYHLLKSELVDPMKEWITGEKHQCPSYERGS